MLKSKMFALLVTVILVPIVALMWSPQPTAAQSDFNDIADFACKELQSEMQNDPELADLVAKYAEVLDDQSLSADDLAKLIAEEESEKAKTLGIRIQFSADTVTPDGLSLCIRPIWGNGEAIWNFSNPGRTGAKYSVLPETGSTLRWATPPKQFVDAIYKASWGDCNAYKLPNSATATFFNFNDWEVCYNATACATLGHCPRWVNPCNNSSPEGGWPNSPLR